MVDCIPMKASSINDWARAFDFISREKPWMMQRIKHASTISQSQSKLWLSEELSKLNVKKDEVALLGGWFAHIITPLLLDDNRCGKVVNFEIDRDAKDISYKFNNRYNQTNRYSAIEKNIMFDKLPSKFNFDLIINTSCEHMFNMSKFRELNNNINPIYILQSTDNDEYDDHINCVKNENELAEQADIKEIYFKGSKLLDNGMIRFMVIGK